MRILTVPNPVLSMTSKPIEDPTSPDVTALARQLEDIMYSTNGCGIAAPQVGISSRLVVADCQWDDTGKKKPIVMVNPVITSMSDEMGKDAEGCLSVPGVLVKLNRAVEVEFSYYDLKGKEFRMSSGGLFSRCVQHEVDHLDGKTMLDRVSGVRKIQALGAYKMACNKGAVPGCDPLFAV